MFQCYRSRSTSQENTPACTVCYDTNTYRLFRQLPCGHKFHRKCINPWADQYNSCPLCRDAIDKLKPILKCRVDTEDEDRDFALQLQQDEYDLSEFMNSILDDVVWNCAECDNIPCICERNLE